MLRALPLVVVLAGAACRKAPPEPPAAERPAACAERADGTRHFRILHLNDVYRIGGLADGRGGLARVRTLRAQAEVGCEDDVLLTHAGDALHPSLLSRRMHGAQMVEILNHLDGDPAAMDPRMVFTFGNHEFDEDALEDAPTLQARIDQSQFRWLDTNLAWAEGPDGPHIASEKLHSQVMLELGGVRVGVFGLTLDSKQPAYVSYIDPDVVGVARSRTADLREQGAEVVIALTHLEAAQDRLILDRLRAAGPDLVLGGHDHQLQTLEVGDHLVLKGDADAVRVRLVDVAVGPSGAIQIGFDGAGVPLGPESPPPDPAVQAAVERLEQAFAHDFCGEEGPGCLARPLTTTCVDLHAEETTIRRFETNLGDWVADRMLDLFEGESVDAAIINSGALRLNQDVKAGTALTRRMVEELFAYPTPVHVVQIDGATLQSVLDRSVEDWSGSGHFLQVAGLAFHHDVARERASDVVLLDGAEARPLDPEGTYRVATVRYLLDPSMGDQDGYTMLSLDQEVELPHSGTDLKAHVLETLASTEGCIRPEREGRICPRGAPAGGRSAGLSLGQAGAPGDPAGCRVPTGGAGGR